MRTKEVIKSLGGTVSNNEELLISKFYHVNFCDESFNFPPIHVDTVAVYGSNLDDVLLLKLLKSIQSDNYLFASCLKITDKSSELLKELALSRKVELLDVGIDQSIVDIINRIND
ncbi:hypothetical protein [Maribacter sp. UBA849]|uniref:hypothetical protein n=1 Tax=Maribacter sp. UBA849 TaxID=1946806 RepID=UPI00258056A5|nr:hypothetical protein [Maribacter sp. UBA849]|tara:strand:- start:551 stop:895 length:345 start_codon:yes stop_codon:yes gene_type:complete